jgi:hypothetical protein
MSDYEEELSALRRMRDGQTPLTREAFRRVRQQHSATHTHTHTHTDTHTDADTGAATATATRTHSDTSTVRVVMPATKRRHSIRPLTALEASERVSDAVVERQENIDITDTTGTTGTTSLDTPSDRDHLSENERVSECVSDRESDPTPSQDQDQDQVLQTSPSHTSTSASASANVNVRVSKCESEEVVPRISLTAQHDRLTATVLVLLETLQEQGALRALLEHTGSVTTVDSEVGDSEGMQQRLTGTLLELEKTVNKVSVECTRMTYSADLYVYVCVHDW